MYSTDRQAPDAALQPASPNGTRIFCKSSLWPCAIPSLSRNSRTQNAALEPLGSPLNVEIANALSVFGSDDQGF